MEISSPKAFKLKKNARDTALGLLARREHSRQELKYKLTSRDFEASEVEDLLDRLEAERLLSNERFAEAYVRSRQLRGFGPLKIRVELKERGIPDELISHYIDTAADEWLQLAKEQYQKKFGFDVARSGDGDAAAKYKLRAKQSRFLQQRGFSSDIIRNVLDDVN